MTTALVDLLRARYADPRQCVFMREVADSTGGASRYCDVLVMGLWRSRGFGLHGHELKVSRSDWLREIQDPGKAETFARHCHSWWIVATPGVVKLEELPATWGLMEAKGDGLRVRKPATQNPDPPLPPWPMLASILRRAAEPVADIERRIVQARSEGYREGLKDGRSLADDHATKELERLQAAVDEFQRASGVSIYSWNAGRVGEAVRAVMGGRERVNVLPALQAAKAVVHNLEAAAREVDALNAARDGATA